jgi:hypothetical protein
MTALWGVQNIWSSVQKTRKDKKVRGSQDDDFVVSWRCKKTSVFPDFDVFPNKLALMGLRPSLRPTYALANPDFLLRGFGTQPRVRLSVRKGA